MKTLQINFVSDVVCPWCAIGLSSLEIALDRVKDDIQANIHFEPFQLNPDMPSEGQEITEHLTQKYGITVEQTKVNYENIRKRGADLGFDFRAEGRGRTWNTLGAHRLLHWAGEVGATEQTLLKKNLLKAYFTDGNNPSAPDVLLQAATHAGLDAARAKAVIESDEYAQHVKARLRMWQQQGISGVPAVIINNKHLISGGQPPEYFEQALRKVAEMMDESAS